MTDSPFHKQIPRAEFDALIGQEIGVSRWFVMDQARIDAFARITEDEQFIHIDPERAKNTMFGGTVAHGMLTLSMLSAMAYDAFPALEGMKASVNYGFDRLRFVTPVRAESRLRARFVLSGLEERSPDRLMASVDVTVEIEGQEKPALTAAWRIMYLT
ncbi:MaoC family dehydratase [Aestuariivita boseongensis]|uniref:MaoC family dehydratase n=1 Tax=Aestuariivita boseongensis TaxID=1470562 RepID=UPI0006836976|nr:MaoC family dehydratase [Aestuariivita boseongensis]